MPVHVVIGAQYGDEGKGRVIDYLAKDYDIVARFNGGCNAGHTVVVKDKSYKTRLLPSAFTQPHVMNVLTQGVLIDIEVLMAEIVSCPREDITDNLIISDDAFIVLPFHKTADAMYDCQRKKPIGTTKNGIGPAVVDKVRRVGIRVGELKNLWKVHKRIIEDIYPHWKPLAPYDHYAQGDHDRFMGVLETFMDKYGRNIGDTVSYLHSMNKAGRRILLEGAQATMLDLDHGTYPYVTSSSCVSAAASLYTGLPPRSLEKIYGIFKAYVTRVGEGPFASEADKDFADKVREVGKEYGTVTGRPRRIGYLDLVELKAACQINGFDELIMTKFDVLQKIDYATVPVRVEHNTLFKTKVSCVEDYVDIVQSNTHVSVTMVSMGAERDAMKEVRVV